MTDLTKMLRQYEDLLEEAEDAERIASAKLSEAQRHKRYWQRRIADIKADMEIAP